MKTHIAIAAVAALVAVVTLRAQVEIPIEPVTVQAPVTVTQNVTLSAVPVQAIRFDIVNQRIELQLAAMGGGNRTITLRGPVYDAVRAQLFDSFATQIAPAVRAKLAELEYR